MKVVAKLEDFKVSQSDFISENKGRFRDFYSIGSALGTGNDSLSCILLFLTFIPS